jgi:hypothetical protein
MNFMKVMTGRVVDGGVSLGGDLPEGAVVAILASDETGVHLDSAQEAELSAALEEIRSGQFTDGAELIRELKGLKGP